MVEVEGGAEEGGPWGEEGGCEDDDAVEHRDVGPNPGRGGSAARDYEKPEGDKREALARRVQGARAFESHEGCGDFPGYKEG